ncbi:hypothetical protein [Shewanella sp. SG41-4]|jgi:hypothetical protein|uniref:hypothetical protein n=1 Tax=Shewanella TaxID=22 RepID=UPI0016039E3A|nr:hypothetical protein [Shewanella sp. SG41-4]MBB1438389.1 hypothetical protein [Shewanella sp. SG41-4]|tara:strand:+ start:46680 stop:47432 length:753 start_codon:yes stop_codon:yes gene_type:complete
MKNLNDLKVINVESNTESGFFHVEFSTGNSLQCCLKHLRQSEDEFFENGPIFLNQIEHDNSGFDDGLCADCNEWAFVDGEKEHILEFLINRARENGVQISVNNIGSTYGLYLKGITMPVKKSVRLVDDTIRTCNNLTQSGDVNWSGSLNAMSEQFNILIEENTPFFRPEQWTVFYCAYNGLISHPDIREEAKQLHWNISEGYQYDGQIRELLGDEQQALAFIEVIKLMSLSERIAIIYKAKSYWRQGLVA